MLLQEMFSNNNDLHDDINWGDDLKFFIDNDERLLEKYILSVVDKHKEHANNPNVWKLYMPGVKKCCAIYCQKFNIDSDEKFNYNVLQELAKQFANQQTQYIQQGERDAT